MKMLEAAVEATACGSLHTQSTHVYLTQGAEECSQVKSDKVHA